MSGTTRVVKGSCRLATRSKALKHPLLRSQEFGWHIDRIISSEAITMEKDAGCLVTFDILSHISTAFLRNWSHPRTQLEINSTTQNSNNVSLHGKNDFVAIFKNWNIYIYIYWNKIEIYIYIDLKIILLDQNNYQNNCEKNSSITRSVAKSFDILATSWILLI